MGRIAARYADRSYITDDNPRFEEAACIRQQIGQGFQTRQQFTEVADRGEAIQQSIHNAKTNDVILIAGKGHENYQLINDTRIPFNDTQIAQAALQTWQKEQG